MIVRARHHHDHSRQGHTHGPSPGINFPPCTTTTSDQPPPPPPSPYLSLVTSEKEGLIHSKLTFLYIFTFVCFSVAKNGFLYRWKEKGCCSLYVVQVLLPRAWLIRSAHSVCSSCEHYRVGARCQGQPVPRVLL
jgi:hypothetical protein